MCRVGSNTPHFTIIQIIHNQSKQYASNIIFKYIPLTRLFAMKEFGNNGFTQARENFVKLKLGPCYVLR